MLNLKHLFLYVAPFVGIYYLSISYPTSLFSLSAIKKSVTQVIKLAFLVFAVFGLSLYNFVSKGKDLTIKVSSENARKNNENFRSAGAVIFTAVPSVTRINSFLLGWEYMGSL